MLKRRYLLPLLLTFFVTVGVYSQDIPQSAVQGHNWDVFLKRGAVHPDETHILFVDLLTGETTSVVTRGGGYALTENGVIFRDGEDGHVKLTKPDGIIRDHPFIVADNASVRVDWVVSADRQRIAWTRARKTLDDQLITTARIADAAGTNLRDLLEYGPRPGIRLLPVAFGAGDEELILEAYAEDAGAYSAYARRASLFVLDYSGDEVSTRALPWVEACLCAIGFGDEIILRLAPNAQTMGMDVQIHRWDGVAPQVIPALSRGNYDQAGNVLVSPDDTMAVYALSQVSRSSAASGDIRTVLVLVDLQNLRQTILNAPMRELLQPIGWAEGNGAILFTTEALSATWKLSLTTGAANKVADAAYLGRLSEG